VTRAEDVLIAVGERIKLSITNLIAADLVMGQDGLASVRTAVTMLQQAADMITDLQRQAKPLPRRQPRSVQYKQDEWISWQAYLDFCKEHNIVPAQHPDETPPF
jgi:hypothetical protein